MSGWIGVDLDGTIAHYDDWVGVEHIGEPIEPMVSLVKQWLSEGKDVRIFTARVADEDNHLAAIVVQKWCIKHLGRVLPVTNKKDFEMLELWDDRAVSVETNTGRVCDDRMVPETSTP